MLPVKKTTVINLITNLVMVALAVIDVRAAALTALLLFVLEHGGVMNRRERRRE